MSRKDFELIARVVKNADLPDEAREAMARDFASELAGTNARFNKIAFLEACGVVA